MLKNFSQSSKEQLDLNDALVSIRLHTQHNQLQWGLLDKRARTLSRGRWTPGRSTASEILVIVEEIQAKISNIPNDRSEKLNIQLHEQACEALRHGMAQLNAQMVRSRTRIEKDKLKEETAIQQDRIVIEKAARTQANLVQPAETEIKIYRMSELPEEEPITLSGRYLFYADITWYLYNYEGVLKPELWKRLENQHDLGKRLKGFKWEFAPGDQHIDSTVLGLVNLENLRTETYIVALSHEIDGRESAIPLDVIQFFDLKNQDKQCCDPFCHGNLRSHFHALWPDRRVIDAKTLSRPYETVMDTAFHTNRFPPRTNNLYLQWRPI